MRGFSWITGVTGGGGGSSNSFTTIQPDLGTAPVASSATDTLTLTSTVLGITGNSGTKTITFTYLNNSIDLTTKVTGILPVANGGTNSSAALNNNRVMQSSGGAVVEAAAITASRALVSDTNGIPVASAVTATTLAFLDATSSVQTQLNAKQTTTLTDGNILVGNGSNVATSVNPSGDIDISNAGVFSINSGVIVNADVSGSAAIDFSKLAALPSTNILVGNGSNVATAVAMSADGTLSNAGALTIGTGVVTYAKMQTFGANRMIANNTAGAAAPAEHPFISKAAATLSSTVTWTGTTAPSGSTTFEYGFQQTGNKVNFWIALKYSVAGATLQAVAIEFPSDMPTPYEPVGLTAASEKLYSITGMIDSASTGSAGVCRAWIRRNAADNNYEAFVQTGSGSNNSILAWVNGQYFTS